MDKSQKKFGDIKQFQANWPAGSGMYAKASRLINRKNVRGRHGGLSDLERARFCDFARTYDVIWFHSLMTADLTGLYHIAHSVLDLDDLNSEKYKLEANVTRGMAAKGRLRWLHTIWHRWEQDMPYRFNAVCVCSPADKPRLGGKDNIFVIPNGFDLSPVETSQLGAKDLRLGFIGTLRYHPNIDGVSWFVKEVLSSILDRSPQVRIRIVGELPPGGTGWNHPSVDWLGFVEDVASEISSWTASIVPLRIGGGTRIKILEAFSRRCPVVSTRIGAYGLEIDEGRHLLMAETAKDFADCCVRVLEDKELAQGLAEAGWQLFVQRYTWDAIQPAVEAVVRKVAGNDGA